MDIEQLRDELSTLYQEHSEAVRSGDSDWIKEIEEAILSVQRELAYAEEESDTPLTDI